MTSTVMGRDESLKCRSGLTPTRRNALHQADLEWASRGDGWWSPLYQAFVNFIMLITLIPLNVLILLLAAWPLVLSYRMKVMSLDSILYLILTYVFARVVLLYLQPDEDPKDSVPPKEKLTVAVIGAGPAGLVTAKELIAEGHVPVVFEQSSAIGGVWQRTGKQCGRGQALANTMTSSSALNTAFSDFPIQAEYPGPDPYFASQEAFMDYLSRYAKYFGVDQYVKLNTIVKEVTKMKDGRWQIKTVQTSSKVETVQEFDKVAVCSGQTAVPRIIKFEGQDNFKGNIIHSSELFDEDDFERFRDKRVLVVGGGETASDVVLDLCDKVNVCDVSLRNPLQVLPRSMWGLPPDYYETRVLYQAPRFARWATYKLVIVTTAFFNNAFARQYGGKMLWAPSIWWNLRLLFTKKYISECLTGVRTICSSVQTTKSDNLVFALSQNKEKCSIRSGVKCINNDGAVVLDDGSIQQYDAILLMTGYQPSKFPFLPKAHMTNKVCERYLGVFHPDLRDMAFIGFMRGQVGSLIMGFEMQARWFALICSKKRNLISEVEMQAHICESARTHYCYNATSGVWFYTNYLARHCVGCEPNFVRFFLHAPVACVKAYCSQFAAYQFRMRGPHSDPQSVVDGYALSDGIIYMLPAWHCLDLLWVLQGFCFEVWGLIPGLAVYLAPLLSQWT